MTRRAAAVVGALATLAACTAGGNQGDDPPAAADVVRLDQVQVLGTHNSYRAPMTPELLEIVTAFDRDTGLGLDYAHPPLREQLEEQGARQLELDVFADPDGGLYADRRALALLQQPVASGIADLAAPGFKVLHSADIDFNSTCLTFVACLREVRAWSQEHRSHLPVLILVEAKDDATPDPAGLGFVQPPRFDAAMLGALDREIGSVFAPDELVTPADRVDGRWPALADARGKVLFALDNDDLHDVYAGDVLFTEATGIVKLNDPLADASRIRARVLDGFLVRTRADADTLEARAGDTRRRDAALVSGAHFVSTDYLVADARFGDYSVSLPGGAVARCNPVSAPACETAQLRE